MFSALINGEIFTGKSFITGKALLLENGDIKGLIDPDAIPADATIVDCQEAYIAPGFIDLQVYGGGGYLFSNKPSVTALQAVIDGLVKTGTTSFGLTLATNPPEIVRESISIVRENPHPALLGLHLEGPWINPVKRGAHLEKYIHPASKEEVAVLLHEAAGVINMVTLAPEVNGPAIITLLREQGIIVSAGHSNATYQQAVAGFHNGIQTTTHLFNAMSPFHHRDTGLPGAAFQTEGIYASIIADGVHVDFATLSISKKLLGERLFLITDAVEATSEGPYVHVQQADRFTLPDGTLSGSKLTMLKAVQNCVEQINISLEEAIRMATLYPARLAGRTDLGRIEPGCKANLLVFNRQYEVVKVLVEGNLQ